MKAYTLFIQEPLLNAFRTASEKTGTSVSELMRTAMQEFIGKCRKLKLLTDAETEEASDLFDKDALEAASGIRYGSETREDYYDDFLPDVDDDSPDRFKPYLEEVGKREAAKKAGLLWMVENWNSLWD